MKPIDCWCAAVKFWNHHLHERRTAFRYYIAAKRNGNKQSAKDFKRLKNEHAAAAEFWLERAIQYNMQI